MAKRHNRLLDKFRREIRNGAIRFVVLFLQIRYYRSLNAWQVSRRSVDSFVYLELSKVFVVFLFYNGKKLEKLSNNLSTRGETNASRVLLVRTFRVVSSRIVVVFFYNGTNEKSYRTTYLLVARQRVEGSFE